MSLRFQIAALIYMMLSAVLSGFGLVTVLAKPRLASHASALVPAVIVASLVLAAPLAWFMARRLIARFSHEQLSSNPKAEVKPDQASLRPPRPS